MSSFCCIYTFFTKAMPSQSISRVDLKMLYKKKDTLSLKGWNKDEIWYDALYYVWKSFNLKNKKKSLRLPLLGIVGGCLEKSKDLHFLTTCLSYWIDEKK